MEEKRENVLSLLSTYIYYMQLHTVVSTNVTVMKYIFLFVVGVLVTNTTY